MHTYLRTNLHTNLYTNLPTHTYVCITPYVYILTYIHIYIYIRGNAAAILLNKNDFPVPAPPVKNTFFPDIHALNMSNCSCESPLVSFSSLFTYIYIYTYICVCMHVCVYVRVTE